MSTRRPVESSRSPEICYRIDIKGVLGTRWSEHFGGLSVTPQGDRTVIRGSMDQAALHGLLTQVRDLGLQLLGVETVDGEPPWGPDPTAASSDSREE